MCFCWFHKRICRVGWLRTETPASETNVNLHEIILKVAESTWAPAVYIRPAFPQRKSRRLSVRPARPSIKLTYACVRVLYFNEIIKIALSERGLQMFSGGMLCFVPFPLFPPFRAPAPALNFNAKNFPLSVRASLPCDGRHRARCLPGDFYKQQLLNYPLPSARKSQFHRRCCY